MMKLSDDVLVQLKTAKSDPEVCRIIAESGYDIEEFEKSLPDEFIQEVRGGYKPLLTDFDVHCPECGNGEEKEISRQFWASMFTDSATKYRCRKCNQYFTVDCYGRIRRD